MKGRIAAGILALGVAVTLGAQTAKPKNETQAELRKEAKVSFRQARATALKEVPNGRVQSSELEREKGKLIYAFDVKVPGKSGVEEVTVDAINGAVVGREHETPKMEMKEAAKEKAAKK